MCIDTSARLAEHLHQRVGKIDLDIQGRKHFFAMK
jgi:hypothetical protein